MQIKFNDIDTLQEINNKARFGDVVSVSMAYREGGSGFDIDGDLLAMKVNPEAFLQWGHSYVLNTSNGLVITKLMPGSDVDKVTCVSSCEKAYPSFEIDKSFIDGFYLVVANQN